MTHAHIKAAAFDILAFDGKVWAAPNTLTETLYEEIVEAGGHELWCSIQYLLRQIAECCEASEHTEGLVCLDCIEAQLEDAIGPALQKE